MNGKNANNVNQKLTPDLTDTLAIDQLVNEMLPFISPEVIEAESIFDMIDEDMNYPDWS